MTHLVCGMTNSIIKDWAEEDRPREKLLNRGKKQMTDAELLAIILGSGSVNLSAVELAKQVLIACENNLSKLTKYSASDLCKFNGIGNAKAISVIASFELGKRAVNVSPKRTEKIQSSMNAYRLFEGDISDLSHEEFWVAYLNRNNQVIEKFQLSMGGITGTVADVRLIYKKGVENGACSIIVAHNHPSGNLKPSQADIKLTNKIKKGGELLDINLIDHLIITEASYLSFADEGLL